MFLIADLNVAFVVVAIRILLLEEKEQFVKDDELSLCPLLAHMDLTLALWSEANIIIIHTQLVGYKNARWGMCKN